jgi:hypothetical protein
MSAKSFIHQKAKTTSDIENNIHFEIKNDRLTTVYQNNKSIHNAVPFFSAILDNDTVNSKLKELLSQGRLEYKEICLEYHARFNTIAKFQKLTDPLDFIKLNDLSDAFSFFQTGETIIIVDRDKELWHTNATGRFETFEAGQVITDHQGQQATLLGVDLEASYDNLQLLGMMSENSDRYHHQDRPDPAPGIAEPAPEPTPEALPARKFSVQKVIVNLCELYRNNETSVIEQPDFKRRFDRETDPLVKVHGFSPKQLYTDPQAVNSFLRTLPHSQKVAMAGDRNSLYSLLSNYHRQAQNAVDKFEYAYGPVKDFCPAATEQVIAYLAFLDDKKMLGKDQLMKQGLERLEKASTMPNMNTDYTSGSFTMNELKAHLSKSFANVEDAQHERHKIRYKTR